MLRLPGLVQVAARPLRLGVSSFYEQTANVCSVCASIIRKAQEQHALEGPEKTSQHPRYHQHLVLPPRRHLQQTTNADSPNPQSIKDFDISTHWGYAGKYGVNNWAQYFHACSGSSQSPVDLSDLTVKRDNTLTPFTLVNFETDNIAWYLTNNGHTAQVTYTSGNICVSGGGLGSEYIVEQFHFHWGENNTVGSEHTINGHRFPMEMHVVTYSREYGNFSQAVSQADGLAVLGIFFEVGKADNKNFSELVKALEEIKKPLSRFDLPPQALMSLLPENKNDYYRYSGSLTTPPCSEVVTWTLFKDTLPISSEQLEAFRSLDSIETDELGNTIKLVNNYRPLQQLNRRKIKKSF